MEARRALNWRAILLWQDHASNDASTKGLCDLPFEGRRHAAEKDIAAPQNIADSCNMMMNQLIALVTLGCWFRLVSPPTLPT